MNFASEFCPDCSAQSNMEIDRGMMDSTIPTLRVYTWSPSAISLGMSQDDSILDMDECRAQGIAVVKRFTGGAAVLHKDDVTYSFFYPSSLEPRYSAREMRGKFMNIFMEVFGQLGMNVSASENAKWQMPDSAVCFHSPGENEILADERKIVGSAQCVKRCGIFQHGSIVLKSHEDLLCKILGAGHGKDAITGIWDYRPEVTPAEVYELIKKAVGNVFGWSC